MASTSNKNTPGNYELETRSNNYFTQNMLFTQSAWGHHDTNYLPGDGVFSTRMTHNELANNGVDIESYLRGTRTTDLTELNKPEFKPSFKELKSLHIYNKPNIILPTPLIVETKQRPAIFQ